MQAEIDIQRALIKLNATEALVEKVSKSFYAIAYGVAELCNERLRDTGKDWYNQQTKHTRVEMDGTSGAEIHISRKVMHNYHGGEIRPKTRTRLALPLPHSGVGDMWPSELTQRGRKLFVLKDKTQDRALLMEDLGNGNATPLYILLSSVRKRPHPDILPTSEEMGERIEEDVEMLLRKG